MLPCLSLQRLDHLPPSSHQLCNYIVICVYRSSTDSEGGREGMFTITMYHIQDVRACVYTCSYDQNTVEMFFTDSFSIILLSLC